MSEEKVLTKEIVEELVRIADDLKYDERLDFLKPYTSITLEAAEKIGNEFGSRGASWFHFPCIKEIEPKAAEHLAKVSVLTFDALETISPETAEALAKHKGSSLELGGTWELSPQVAYKLSFHLGSSLILSSVTELGPLEFTEPDLVHAFWPDILTWQGKWAGFMGGLSFPGIQKIPDTDLEKLSRPDMFPLSWGWTQVYSSAYEGSGFTQGSKHTNLIFENLSEITEVSAKALCKTVGRLELGITSLPDDAAKCFADYQGGGLALNKLTSLSDSAAESLTKTKCDLDLNGLTELSDSAAESLSRHEGKLCLGYSPKSKELQAKVDSFKDG
jgi:hypothetical protein